MKLRSLPLLSPKIDKLGEAPTQESGGVSVIQLLPEGLEAKDYEPHSELPNILRSGNTTETHQK